MDYMTVILIYIIVNFFIVGYSFSLWLKNKASFDGLFLWTMAIAVQQLGVICIVMGQSLPNVISTVIASGILMLSVVLVIQAVGRIIQAYVPTVFNYALLAGSVLVSSILFYVWDIKSLRIIVFSAVLAVLFLQGSWILITEQRKQNERELGIITTTMVILGVIYLLRIGVHQWGASGGNVSIITNFEILLVAGDLIGNILLVLGIVTVINGTYMKKLKEKTDNYEKLMKKASELAETDELTGLANRRHFNSRTREEILRSERYGNRVSIILVDLDDFKMINDSFGHDVGDELIIRIGDILISKVRRSDVVARWGGDEFIIMLLETGGEEAVSVANNLKNAVNNIDFDHDVNISASFGVAERMLGESYTSWFKKADRAIYDAKNAGRNQVVFCHDDGLLREQIINLQTGSKYISGIDSVDEEHEQLLEMVLDMYEVEDNNRDILILKGKALMAFVEQHFSNEEKVMTEYRYPGLAHHHKAHGKLIKDAKKALDNISQKKGIPAKAISYVVKEMVIEHLLKEDMAFFKYYKSVS